MRRPSIGWVAVAVGLACGAPAGVRAEDRLATVPLEFRLYPVRSMTRGHPVHQGDRGPFPASADDVNDEVTPLYGAESDERGRRFDAITETMQAEAGTAEEWEREGTNLTLIGDRLLLVRGSRDLQTRIAAWLDRAARADLRTAVVDVAAFRGDAGAGRGEGGIPAAIASGAWAPLGAVRVAVQGEGASVARAGTLRAYVLDYDVEVAEDGNTADPLVGVLPEGLSVEVRASTAGDGLALDLRGWWAAPATWADRATAEGDRYEVPTSEGSSFEATLGTSDGTWALLAGSGAVSFAARARLEPLPAAAVTEGVLLPGPVGPTSDAALTLRSYDVRDLALPIVHARGATIALWPSNYTPPRPPALPEAAPPLALDAILELVTSTAPPGAWEREGASAQAAGMGLVRVRTDAAHHAQIAALLDRLRETVLPTTRLRATVLSLPWASLPEWWQGLPDDLLRDGAAPLRARPGARVVATGALRLRDGERRSSVSGTARSYVGDYDVEIAKASAIGNPILRSVLDGLSLDVEHDRAYPARAADVVLRMDVGRVLGMREVPTRHGTIECPVLAIGRTRGETVVPWGTTRVAAAWAAGAECHLVLLTASGE